MNKGNNVSVEGLSAIASECRAYARRGMRHPERLTGEEKAMYLEACLRWVRVREKLRRQSVESGKGE